MAEAKLSQFPCVARTKMASTVLVKMARDFGARYFAAIDRADLAGMVVSGEADDFPEIQAAIEQLGAHVDKIARFEDALIQYADPTFWDQALPGGPLAIHDSGEMARNVLAGRSASYHRD